jgi:hypothetical protein
MYDSFVQDMFELLTAAKFDPSALTEINPSIGGIQKSMAGICSLATLLRE